MKNKELDKEIKNNIASLTSSISELIGSSSMIELSDLNNLLTTLAYLRDLKQTLEAVNDPVKTMFTKLQTETVPEAMSQIGLESAKVGKYTFTVGSVLHVSIPYDKREKGFEWLRNNSLGDIIKEEANPKTLSTAIKHYLEETGKTPPDEAMSMHMTPTISIRKNS